MQARSLRYFMHLVTAPLAAHDATLPAVALRTDRRLLAKRLWRGVAADGTEFGFQLGKPLQPGDTFYQTATARYVIEQEPEPVLEISLAGLPPSATAGIGWAVGNLHLEFSSEATRLLTPDEPAARQLFARIQVAFTPTSAVFRPGRFKRSVSTPLVDDLGPSHKH
jgi:urease accessory protein